MQMSKRFDLHFLQPASITVAGSFPFQLTWMLLSALILISYCNTKRQGNFIHSFWYTISKTLEVSAAYILQHVLPPVCSTEAPLWKCISCKESSSVYMWTATTAEWGDEPVFPCKTCFNDFFDPLSFSLAPQQDWWLWLRVKKNVLHFLWSLYFICTTIIRLKYELTWRLSDQPQLYLILVEMS